MMKWTPIRLYCYVYVENEAQLFPIGDTDHYCLTDNHGTRGNVDRRMLADVLFRDWPGRACHVAGELTP